MKQKELEQNITDRILASLQQGVKPWKRPWLSEQGFPASAFSGKMYSGVNVISCILHAMMFNHNTNLYGTFNQWRGKKCCVRKGEKGVQICYYGKSAGKETVNAEGEMVKGRGFAFLRYFVAFNLAQVEGEYADQLRAKLAGRIAVAKPDTIPAETRSKAEKLLGQAKVEYGERAYYNLTSDKIVLLHPERFKSWYSYYATGMHELTHWSGAESRLNRLDKLARFGNMLYAAEELVAEIGGCFLSASIGLPVTEELEGHASYIDHWVSLLANDRTAIFRASSAASAATAYLLKGAGLAVEEATEEEEPATA